MTVLRFAWEQVMSRPAWVSWCLTEVAGRLAAARAREILIVVG